METIGPNKKEAETVLHQRLYEVRSGKYPILRRHSRVLFRDFVEEWIQTYAAAHVRPSTRRTYEGQLKFQLLPVFGDRALSALTSKSIQDFFSEAVSTRRLAPKTANNSLVLLKEMLEGAVEWGYLTANPARSVRMFKRLPIDMRAWTVAEIRKFLLAAEEP